MSGHSKWSSIKHSKGLADAKRGKIFSKYAVAIALASKEANGDVDLSPKLRLLVDRAKAAGMPKDNIERAIKRGTGEGGDAGIIEEIYFEGYGPGGVALIMHAITDNRNRAVADVKHILSKFDGKMGGEGSVKWMFREIGTIVIDKEKWNAEFEMKAIEAGAVDIKVLDDVVEIETGNTDLHVVKSEIEKFVEVADAYLEWVGNQNVDVADQSTKDKIDKLIESLDDSQDIEEIFTNANYID
jgi:YebC/PmpR family DNA-binding regulatory protein